jgi:thiamine-monophosphate kinase
LRISQFGGEPAVIDLISRICDGQGRDDLVLGIGDDAALVQVPGDDLLIITTDLLIEGTHFRRDIIDPYSLGWKSVAANISDIAAMAGTPTYTFSSFALDDVEVDFVENLYQGMTDCAKKYGSRIVGGDTNISQGSQVINITQLGTAPAGQAILRSGAQPGDRLLVTWTLGDSRLGLELLLKFGLEKATDINICAVDAHLRPEPRIAEAKAAAATGKLHAMMDISDGLAADLPKMCAASGVGAIVDTLSRAISPIVRGGASGVGIDPTVLAVQGGEEYELLMAVPENAVDSVIKTVADATGTQVTAIGRITAERDVLIEGTDGSRTPLRGGWTHFEKQQ